MNHTLSMVAWAGLLVCAVGAAAPAPEKLQARAKGASQKEWKLFETETLAQLDGFTPAAQVETSAYGGWRAHRYRATGFFRVERADGRWWLVDPEGYAFLSVGVNSVNVPEKGPGKEAFPRVFPDAKAWAPQAGALLRGCGFNTLGCWSDEKTLQAGGVRMPYCLRWNFMQTYRQRRYARYGKPANAGMDDDCLYVFDPEFAQFCDEHARQLEATRDDPWLLGHFSDNELNFKETEMLRRYLARPDGDPCRTAAEKLLRERGRDAASIRPEDDRAFCRLVVGEYYRIVSGAIRKHDPNHLYIGTRYHGLALRSPALFEGAGPYADVISVNYYNRWSVEGERLAEWSRLSGRPILLTEWYARGLDSPLDPNSGAGWTVPTQADRARFYQHFALSALRSPECVGWHWFRYQDDVANKGMVDHEFRPYEALTAAMKELNAQAYPLAEFVRGR